MKKHDYIAPFVFVVASFQFFISVSAKADTGLIEKLNLDKDGQISMKEAVSNLTVPPPFSKIDTDGNGIFSSIELTKTKVLLTAQKNIGLFK